jgi:hypothetical protein
MGEPKMPDFNPEEYKKKRAEYEKVWHEEAKEQWAAFLMKTIERMRSGKHDGYCDESWTMQFFNTEDDGSIHEVSHKNGYKGEISFAENRAIVDSVLEETGFTKEECEKLVEEGDRQEYTAGVSQLIEELRKNKRLDVMRADYEGKDAVEALFNSAFEPVSFGWNRWVGSLLSAEEKREIISKVLAETGLTEEEARGLLASKDQK